MYAIFDRKSPRHKWQPVGERMDQAGAHALVVATLENWFDWENMPGDWAGYEVATIVVPEVSRDPLPANTKMTEVWTGAKFFEDMTLIPES